MDDSFNLYPIVENDNYIVTSPDKIKWEIIFESYHEDSLLGTSSKKRYDKQFLILSGTLYCNQFDNNKFGYTNSKHFQMLGLPKKDDKLVKLDNFEMFVKINILKIEETDDEFTGIHLLGRYTDEDNFYICSFKVNGEITLKEKINGKYNLLAKAQFEKPIFGRWYTLSFKLENDKLTVNYGKQTLFVINNNIKMGSFGIMSDNIDLLLDEWIILPIKIEN